MSTCPTEHVASDEKVAAVLAVAETVGSFENGHLVNQLDFQGQQIVQPSRDACFCEQNGS